MSVDASSACIAKSSAASTMKYNQISIFHEEMFQLLAPSQCWEMIENNICLNVSSNKFNSTTIECLSITVRTHRLAKQRSCEAKRNGSVRTLSDYLTQRHRSNFQSVARNAEPVISRSKGVQNPFKLSVICTARMTRGSFSAEKYTDSFENRTALGICAIKKQIVTLNSEAIIAGIWK